DLEDAMARLARWGMPGRMEGMQDLLERLRAAKQKRAERHDLSGIFDELKRKVDEVKRLEREGLDRREQQETPDEALKQAMRNLARERRAEGACRGRRSGLRGLPAAVPRARRQREGLGRSAEAAGHGHGRDALALEQHVERDARAARGAARRGIRRSRPAVRDERARR